MKRRFLGVCLAGILVLTSSVTAFAEDRKGASGWEVNFNGKKMSSNFTTANMGDEINAMQPGDSVELTITLKNDFNGEADWYMKNQVLSTLEDAGDAAGGAYDYLLTYTDAAGQTATLYSSEKFGGDGRYNGVGLHGAASSLDDYFYMDRMGSKDKGVVKLKVALDGETLVNNYQNTYARLQMDFATELVTPGTGTPGGGSPGGSGTGGNREVIKTGDQSQIMLYVLMMLGAGFALLLIVFLRLRREQDEAVYETEAGRLNVYYKDSYADGADLCEENESDVRGPGAGIRKVDAAVLRRDTEVKKMSIGEPGQNAEVKTMSVRKLGRNEEMKTMRVGELGQNAEVKTMSVGEPGQNVGARSAGARQGSVKNVGKRPVDKTGGTRRRGQR